MGTVTGATGKGTTGVGTGSTVKQISGMVWATALIQKLNSSGAKVPLTANNINNLLRIVTGETAGQQGGFLRDNNPFNLNTWGSPHSNLPGTPGLVQMTGQGGKPVWVQQFNSVEQGITYTAQTLLAGNNAALLSALRNNAPTTVFGGALANSSWKGAGYSSASGILNYQPFQGMGAVGGQGLTFSPSQGAAAVANAGKDVYGAGKAVVSGAISTATFLGKISNPTTLKNVGIFAGGLVLAGAGFFLLVSSTKTAKSVEGTALKAV